MFQNITTIIWDWNGTLLNDIDICIQSMNKVLSKRNMSVLSKSYYRKIFGFPVINYYKRIGFNFKQESFEKLSIEFIDHYHRSLSTANLFPDAYELLEKFSSLRYRQVLLSAMEQEALHRSVQNLGILSFFDDIIGLSDHYAHSKIENAKAYVRMNNINSENVIIIGDTLHDLEVAQAIGSKCILINNGHQEINEQQEQGITVEKKLKNIFELMTYS